MTPLIAPIIIKLHLKPNQPFDYAKAYQELKNILATHLQWKDSTSLRLHKWGDKTVRLHTPIPSQDTQAFFNVIKNRLEKILGDILLSPIGGAPLAEPVIERDWIWEKETLDEFIALFKRAFPSQDPLSPLDNKKLETMRPHAFAKAIVTWINALPIIYEQKTVEALFKRTFSSSQAIPPTAQVLPQLIQARLYKFVEEGQEYTKALQIRNNLRAVKKKTQALEIKDRQRNQYIKQQADLIAQKQAVHKLVVQESMETTKKNSQGQINLVLPYVQEANQKREKVEADLTRIKEDNEKHAQQLPDVEAQLNHLSQQIQQLHQQLNASKGGSFCLIQ